MMRERFWEDTALSDMIREEWEALCDGCGKCCLNKLEDEDTGKFYTTRVACRLLDTENGCCTNYGARFREVPDCVNLARENPGELQWLPATCAYRLLAAGQPLPDWHPLLTGDPESVHRAGMSVRGRVISEDYVHPDGLIEHIVHWVD